MTATCFNPSRKIIERTGLLIALIAALAVCGTGCGAKPPQQTTAAPPGEIRGEPIRPPEATPPAPPTGASAVNVASLQPAEPDAAPAPTSIQPPPAPPAAPISPPATQQTVPSTPTPSTAEHAPAGQGTADSPWVVGFDRLAAFKYDVPDGPASTNTLENATFTSQIPKDIRALDNQFVALKGFMLPLKVESGLVTEMLIMRDQSMCCFGTVPKINEWVSVKMNGKGVKPVMDQAVTLHGRLHVGEIRENGYLVGIYQMDGDRVIGPLDM